MAANPLVDDPQEPHVLQITIRCHSELNAVHILNHISGLVESWDELIGKTKVDSAGIFPAAIYDASENGEATK